MHTFRWVSVLAIILTLTCVPSNAAPKAPVPKDQAAIRNVLDHQVESWNRGDIVAFMQTYKDAGDTTFVGKTVEHGYSNILARYQKKYATKDKMGTLTFDNLDVRMLDAHYAIVTGTFHLTRTANGGGDAQGIFSLIFEKAAAGWKIVLDHTS